MQPPSNQTIQPTHVYEVQPRRDQRGFDLISDVLPFGGLSYGEPNAVSNAIGYAKFLQPLTGCGDPRLEKRPRFRIAASQSLCSAI
jgi:hypothetical protein